jgi:alpha-tubulin suppressor-like RCC1 family protein
VDAHLRRTFGAWTPLRRLLPLWPLLGCDGGASAEGHRLEVLDGDGQVGELGAPAPRPLAVRVLDLAGRPAAGVGVVWRVLEGGARVSATEARTDAAGVSRTEVTFGIDTGAALVLAESEGGSARFRLRGERRWRSAGAGLVHSCALSSVGEAYCWGGNHAAQLGDGSEAARAAPAPVSGWARFSALAVGWLHGCALDLSGNVLCWGSNDSGQLGTGDRDVRHRPTLVPVGEAAVAIAAGYQHSCAVGRSGAAYCWGSNAQGALGSPVLTGVECSGEPCALTPARVRSELRFVTVAAGEFHTCALAAGGGAHCWGWNSAGEVGTGEPPGLVLEVPAPVHGAHVFTGIAAHARHSCALAEGGRALCWGRSATGESGAGGWAPVELPGGLALSTIDTGNLYTCGAVAGGGRACFGDQSGLTFRTGPHVSTAPAFTYVGVGFAHSCGVAGPEVWCWGANTHGQLGPAGAAGDGATPVRVPLPR